MLAEMSCRYAIHSPLAHRTGNGIWCQDNFLTLAFLCFSYLARARRTALSIEMKMGDGAPAS